MVGEFFIRTITSFIIAILFFFCFYFGVISVSILFVTIFILSCYEWNNISSKLNNQIIFFFGYVLIVLMFFSSFFLYFKNMYLLIFSVLFCAITDISAYIIGKKIGKKKCFKKISPNKTLEGFLYSILIGFLFSFISLWFLYPQIKHFSILVPFISHFGDLFLSFCKRKANIKDTGFIFPGHGGILDRIDSWLFVIPFITFLYFIYSV